MTTQTRLMFFDPSHPSRQSQSVELIVDMPAVYVRALLAHFSACELSEAAPMFIRATTCAVDMCGLPAHDYVEWLVDFGPRAIDAPDAETIAWDVRAWRELVAPADAQHHIPV